MDNRKSSDADMILDGLFCICRPKIVVTRWQNYYLRKKFRIVVEEEFLRSLYTQILMIRKDEHEFNNSQQLKFWQRDLIGVKLLILKDGECVREMGKKLCMLGGGREASTNLELGEFHEAARNL